jgi:hypothetical protein
MTKRSERRKNAECLDYGTDRSAYSEQVNGKQWRKFICSENKSLKEAVQRWLNAETQTLRSDGIREVNGNALHSLSRRTAKLTPIILLTFVYSLHASMI